MPETVVLCGVDEVAEGEIKQASLPDGAHVALYRVGDAIYATADTCTHVDREDRGMHLSFRNLRRDYGRAYRHALRNSA